MNMLTSLKALLFATPASPGVKTDAGPVDGAPDFAQLLNGIGGHPTAPLPGMPAPTRTPLTAAAPAEPRADFAAVEAPGWQPTTAYATPPTIPLAAAPQPEKTPTTVAVAVSMSGEQDVPTPLLTQPALTPKAQDILEQPTKIAPPADEATPRTLPQPVAMAAPIEQSAVVDAEAAVDTAAPAPQVPEDNAPAHSAAPPRSQVAIAPTAPDQAEPATAATASPSTAPNVPAAPVMLGSTVIDSVAEATPPAAIEAGLSPTPSPARAVQQPTIAELPVASAPSTDLPDTPYVDEAPDDPATKVTQDDTPWSDQPIMPTAIPIASAAPPVIIPSDQPRPSPEGVASPGPALPMGPAPSNAPLARTTRSTQPAVSTAAPARVAAPSSDAASRSVETNRAASLAPVLTAKAPAPVTTSIDAAPVTIGQPSAAPAIPVRVAVPASDAAPLPIEAILPAQPAPASTANMPAPVTASIDASPASVEQPSAALTQPARDDATLANPAPAPTVPATPATTPAAPVPVSGAAPVVTAAIAASASTDAQAAVLQPDEALAQPLVPAQVIAPTTIAKPRAEAVSLLQLVRDHMSGRLSHRSEVTAPASDAASDTVPAFAQTSANDGVLPVPMLAQSSAQAPAIAAPTIPTVDLSASLGAQMVDMGVSGQWIDGLARDIAGLSANGAQGRFQINADQLGPIQVDIRQGEDGAAISLTVATEAAEQALRQEGDRLKLDAGLSAVRISEMKIERAHVPEAARTDSGSNQPASQQQSSGQGQNQGQAMGQGAGQSMGQSSAQSHMQGRGQPRENIAFGPKAGNDAAVLNHTDVGESAGGAVRARYA